MIIALICSFIGKKYIQKNLNNLEMMKYPKRINYDPGLIKNVSSDTDVFMSSLLEQKDKFIETSIEKISKAMTQTAMNIEASDNMEISEKNRTAHNKN